MALLLGVELLDELTSGVPAVGAAEIRVAMSTSYAATLGILSLVPGVVALVIEPVLFVLADHYPRKWFVCGGLLAMGGASIAAALAPGPITLALALAVVWVGSGSGVALSQATLVDANPEQTERVLARWVLFGELGDLLAPALLAGLIALGLGWRAGFAIVGLLVLARTALLLRERFPEVVSEDEDEPSVLESVMAALRNRELLGWLAATAFCDLLDDLVVVFAALYLRDELGVDATTRSFVFGAGVTGAIVGAWATERWLARVAPLRLLAFSSVACALVYLAWLATPNVWLGALLFAAVGLTAAPMYPIACAQCYAALPGRSGTVNAAGHLTTPITLALPWLLGLLADTAGLRAALALLLLQPLVLGLAAVLSLRGAPREPDA